MTDYKQPVFRKDWYIDALKRGPIALYNRIKLDIKWAYQRVQRGFSDYDAGDIDIWFEYVMPGIIAELRKQIENTPGYMINGIDDDYYEETFKKYNVSKEDYQTWNTDKVSEETLVQMHNEFHLHWADKLDQMIYLFTEMNDDECSKADELSKDELDKYCDKKRKEALKMLDKYFRCLWN